MNVTTPLYEQLVYFFVCGIFLSLGYELFRVLRVCLPHGTIAVGIEDTLYLSLCGVILFGFAMEVGNGEFRLMYLISAAAGAAVYFLTAGRLIKFIYSAFINFLRRFLKKIFTPIGKLFIKIAHFVMGHFGKVYKIIYLSVKKRAERLKSRYALVYNHNSTNINGDEKVAERPKIKAKIKKE